jgi:hypothetical protein
MMHDNASYVPVPTGVENPLPVTKPTYIEDSVLLRELMTEQLLVLKKIERHLATASGDFNLHEKDVI